MRLTLLLVVITYNVQAQLSVLFHEEFNNNSYGWYEMQNADEIMQIRDGKYYFKTPDGGKMTLLSPYIETSKNFSFEATFTQLDGKIDNGIGFVWGYDNKDINSFTFTTNGYYRIGVADKTRGISDEWVKIENVNPVGEENKLKLEQRSGQTYFYLNGKILKQTKSIPWYGKQMGFVSYTQMRFLVDDFILSSEVQVKLPAQVDLNIVKESMGFNINSSYDEVDPKILSDGKTLYFSREHSPDNTGGVADGEDIWISTSTDFKTWTRSKNLGPPINTDVVNNLLSVSTDNNTFLFLVDDGFSFMHRTTTGWSQLEDVGIKFKNEADYVEGNLSPDGKAIIFAAKLKSNVAYRAADKERDIYICLKQTTGTWSGPFNAGKIINTAGDEISPFMAADGKTLYFGSNGRPGYGDADVYMTKRLSEDWKSWSEPVNLGPGVNSVGWDAYYTLPASGEYGYMVSNIKSLGGGDIIRFKLPQALKPEPVILVSGKVLNAKTNEAINAAITFDDLSTAKEVGEARSDPKTGDYKIALPAGKNYGYHATAPGFLSVNENLELTTLKIYGELKKDLFLVPIEVGESIQLKNVFFVQSKAELKPESFPELDRLAEILKNNPSIEIELSGHTDNRGDAKPNLTLSTQRVEAVKEYLFNKGINKNRMTGKGYGGTQPISPNDSDASRQLNRRVEFKITKK